MRGVQGHGEADEPSVMETGDPLVCPRRAAGLRQTHLGQTTQAVTLVISTKGVREAMVEVRLLVVRAAQIAAEEMAATRAVEEIKIDLVFFGDFHVISMLLRELH